MLKTDTINPVKINCSVLENVISIVDMILTTECALVDIKEEASAGAAMPPIGGGMPGMM